MKNLETAAHGFIEAVHAKMEVEESQFYGDPAIEKAYAALIKVISQGTPKDVEWSWEVLDYCMSFAGDIRHKKPESEAIVAMFAKGLERLLAHISSVEWLACVPLERVFRRFPEFTDFGPFVILNPAGIVPKTEVLLLESFRALLADRCGVTFAVPRDPYNNESYLRLGEHYLKKSGHYIPGRPTLVVKLGRGEERANQRQLTSKLHEILPLFQLCQVALSLERDYAYPITGSHSTLPNGERMDKGLISLPQVAVAINKTNGNCDWWGSGIALYETREGEGYDPDRFREVWHDIAQPVIKLRDLAGPNKCRLAVDNAVRLISRSRHEEFGDSTVNAVIATETILNPFNPAGDIKERFALLTSALTESTVEARRAKYLSGKELYNYRCDAVHRSRFFSEDRKREDHKKALTLFLTCLKAILKWGIGVLERGEKLDQPAFDSFFVESVIR